MADQTVEATVNGRRVARQANPSQRVLDFLRDDLHMTGTKEGCGAGECGTCSVFVDGVLVKSCLLPVAKIAGKKVDTIEGLAVSGERSAVQKAFHKSGASQCGYCIPGMVMAATAALRLNPQADREEIKERLGGNICRCTGYQKIFDAVEMARDFLNGKLSATAFDELDAEDGKYICVKVRRIAAPSKVTGALRYAGDVVLPNMLHVQVLRSPHPHARIVSIDVTDAEASAGVEAVVPCADVPGQDGFGVFVSDQPVMARDKVRYVGEPIAAVAAEDLASARRALAKIRVEYEMLPAVFDPDEAMVEGAPVVHDYAPDNLVKHIPIRKGDVEDGFAKSDIIVEQTYETQQVEHAYLETEAGLAYVDHDGVVTVRSPSQNITHHRHMLSRILNLPINKVRMIMSPVGGGFGGKEDMIYQGMLSLLTMKTRRPVRLVFTREESIATTAKRHPSRTSYKRGSSAAGPTISRISRSTPMASIPTIRRRARFGRSARCNPSSRPSRISTYALSGWAWTRSNCVSKMRCARAIRLIPSSRSILPACLTCSKPRARRRGGKTVCRICGVERVRIWEATGPVRPARWSHGT